MREAFSHLADRQVKEDFEGRGQDPSNALFYVLKWPSTFTRSKSIALPPLPQLDAAVSSATPPEEHEIEITLLG